MKWWSDRKVATENGKDLSADTGSTSIGFTLPAPALAAASSQPTRSTCDCGHFSATQDELKLAPRQPTGIALKKFQKLTAVR